ncbi:hypothetical protein HUK80_00005 [Flavobacterium sp. MAH-1]|uniref:MORN repeat variant n=1 Tax=Flavobacterium agri TaxID=2743471 RepID=A0A7Y8XYG3_9FLAO|nr:hypothetical protein [Flavobacterium agri]NUY79258.1 hypothetical protein [Flavobacterium agri]NYA69282.1 hypothetical protein [Flavobacterium agri]
MKYAILAILCSVHVLNGDPYSIKRVSDANFRYEFHTTAKTTAIREHKTYFWFRGGAIHSAKGGAAGELLDQEYSKFYHSNQLAEKGNFNKGLQTGRWKSWYENGNLQSTQYWNNGLRSGMYMLYDQNGNLSEKGNYKRGEKHGAWVRYAVKDTLWFKNGEQYTKAKPLTKAQKEKAKADKEQERQQKQQVKELQKQKKAALKETAAAKNSDTAKKPGFFKRLFSKKETKK